MFVQCNILSNTYVIYVFENFLRSPLNELILYIYPIYIFQKGCLIKQHVEAPTENNVTVCSYHVPYAL